jgi:uncharacterized protein (DUF2345 family)
MGIEQKTPQHPQPAGRPSPKEYSTREDAYKVAGDYGTQTGWRTQSGHCFVCDDTVDKEHITLQHRSGARLQLGPTGDIQIISHNGQYSVIFGENRMEVTGSNDITVRGGGTIKVDGDYDMTIGGDVNMAADGDFNWVGKSFNFLGGGNFDMEVKNMTVKTEGSATIHSAGAASLVGGTAAGLISQSGSVAISASSSVGMFAKGGQVAIQAAGGNINMKTPKEVAIDGDTNVWINSGKSVGVEVVSWQAPNHPAKYTRRGPISDPGWRHT